MHGLHANCRQRPSLQDSGGELSFGIYGNTYIGNIQFTVHPRLTTVSSTEHLGPVSAHCYFFLASRSHARSRLISTALSTMAHAALSPHPERLYFSTDSNNFPYRHILLIHHIQLSSPMLEEVGYTIQLLYPIIVLFRSSLPDRD